MYYILENSKSVSVLDVHSFSVSVRRCGSRRERSIKLEFICLWMTGRDWRTDMSNEQSLNRLKGRWFPDPLLESKWIQLLDQQLARLCKDCFLFCPRAIFSESTDTKQILEWAVSLAEILKVAGIEPRTLLCRANSSNYHVPFCSVGKTYLSWGP